MSQQEKLTALRSALNGCLAAVSELIDDIAMPEPAPAPPSHVSLDSTRLLIPDAPATHICPQAEWYAMFRAGERLANALEKANVENSVPFVTAWDKATNAARRAMKGDGKWQRKSNG